MLRFVFQKQHRYWDTVSLYCLFMQWRARQVFSGWWEQSKDRQCDGGGLGFVYMPSLQPAGFYRWSRVAHCSRYCRVLYFVRGRL